MFIPGGIPMLSHEIITVKVYMILADRYRAVPSKNGRDLRHDSGNTIEEAVVEAIYTNRDQLLLDNNELTEAMQHKSKRLPTRQIMQNFRNLLDKQDIGLDIRFIPEFRA